MRRMLGPLAAILPLVLVTYARSQGGCGQKQGIKTNTLCQATQEYCVSQPCVPGGIPGNFCNEGYGVCCGDTTYSSSVAPDPTCCQPPAGGCPDGDIWSNCTCRAKAGSPIIVDTTGHGFQLTSAEGGVMFDIAGDGHPVRLAWTAPGSGNALLALDRNLNGKIDDGKELFGNFTSQPASDDPNGYLALAVFDQPENGGNGDGIIDSKDAVFQNLLLWIDQNHDGVSQPNELHHLPEMGIYSLSLAYKDSRRTDQFGNQFRYRGAINSDLEDGISRDVRWSYDVFLSILNPSLQSGTWHNRQMFLVARSRCGRQQLPGWTLNLRVFDLAQPIRYGTNQSGGAQ